MRTIPYSKQLEGRVVVVSPGVLRRTETEVPDGARLDSEVVFAGDDAFREQGMLWFAPGSGVRLRTLGTGSLVQSAQPGLRHGTVIWELDGGSGRFAAATGRISSSFTLTDDGDVTDSQDGLIFLQDGKE